MTKRPLCMVCLVLMLLMCVADRAGFPLIRGNPVPENVDSWIRKHPKVTICGEVTQTTENEFSQSVYLSNTYLIYQPKKNQSKENQPKKISIENVKVFLKKKEDVPAGTIVLVSGNLERVGEMRNPGEFDARQYYASQHIFYFMKKAELLKKSENYSAYRQGMNDLRKYFSEVLNGIGGKEAGIFQAIVLGDKSSLDEEVKLRYQMAGIVHVLAISGLHISVIGMGIYNLLMKTGMGIWPSGIIALLILLQYGVMTGGSVSTMRAVCMFLISVGAKITGRIYDLPTALAVSAMLILGDSGAYLYNSGFLLSFSAVAGAGVVVPALTKSMDSSRIEKGKNERRRKSAWKRHAGKKFKDICCMILGKHTGQIYEKFARGFCKANLALGASIGIQLTMLPVSLYFFGEVSLVGIFLNLLVLPTVGIVLGSGATGLLAGCVSFSVGRVVILPGKVLAGIYEELCKLSGNLPFGIWITGQPKLWQVAAYYILFAGAVWILTQKRKRERKIIAFVVACLAISILIWRDPEPFSVSCLDVGQGDGLVLRTPEGNCFLVDGGSTNKSGVGQYQVLPYLKNQGISQIDGIFISHTDQDHISGVQEILEMAVKKLNSVKLGCLYLPEWENPPAAWEKLKQTAKAAGIPVRTLKEGDCLNAGKLQLQIIAPAVSASGADVNEDGMVIKVKYEEFLGLLTGDIGEETEKKLLELGMLEDVDFLKVGHHGSHYSTCQQFLDTVRPEYAVISCSSTNTYGHPSPEITKRLEETGCQTSFTMESGAVKVCWEKEGIRIKKFLEKGNSM